MFYNLLRNIKNFKCKQFLFVFIRKSQETKLKNLPNINGVTYYLIYINYFLFRIRFFSSSLYLLEFIYKIVINEKIKIIHAHTLFRNGYLAYLMSKKNTIQYIVAVRNTDLNYFLKYLFFLKPLALKIALRSHKIIFISPSYKLLFIDKYVPIKYKKSIDEKSVIIPNGLDNFWFDNIYDARRTCNKTINILYIGDFSKNKNIHVTIQAIQELRVLGLNIHFSIVGGGGNYNKKILNFGKKYPNWITCISRTNDKNELLNIYRNSDIFCMPSRYETFGLVYLEALSQGLPIIYSKGQGIDSFFEDGYVGKSVFSNDILDLKEKILYIVENYEQISFNCTKDLLKFSWPNISNQYFNIYQKILENE